MKQGKLIIVEGTDCSGKSTFVNELWCALHDHYRHGRNLQTYHEPYLDLPKTDSTKAQIFLQTAQRIALYEHIKKDLEQGKIVIVDRSYVSTLVYNCKTSEDEALLFKLIREHFDEELFKNAIWVFVLPGIEELSQNMINRAVQGKLKYDERNFKENAKRNDAYYDIFNEFRFVEYGQVYAACDRESAWIDERIQPKDKLIETLKEIITNEKR